MAVRMRDLMWAQLGELRWEPTAKRVRAEAGGVTLLDTSRAALLWEPKRVVPAYAVGAYRPTEGDVAGWVDEAGVRWGTCGVSPQGGRDAVAGPLAARGRVM